MTGNQKLYTKKSCKVFERLSFVNTERKDLLISSVDTKQKLCKVNFTTKYLASPECCYFHSGLSVRWIPRWLFHKTCKLSKHVNSANVE